MEGIKIPSLEVAEIFNKNTKEIFKQFIDIDLDEKICKMSDVRLYDGVSIIVSLSGIVAGQVIFNISIELAKAIYHRHTKGILAIQIDKNVKEIVLKLLKIIIGNSCASFYGNGISMEVSSYCILEGYDIDYTVINKDVTIIDYDTSLTETNMMLILDIDGNAENSDFNN